MRKDDRHQSRSVTCLLFGYVLFCLLFGLNPDCTDACPKKAQVVFDGRRCAALQCCAMGCPRADHRCTSTCAWKDPFAASTAILFVDSLCRLHKSNRWSEGGNISLDGGVILSLNILCWIYRPRSLHGEFQQHRCRRAFGLRARGRSPLMIAWGCSCDESVVVCQFRCERNVAQSRRS